MEARIFRKVIVSRWLPSLLLIVASIASMGASARGRNFVVQTSDPALARQIVQAAEQYRRDLAVSWLGEAMPDWSAPCVMTVRVGQGLGAGGATTFMFEGGEVFGWRMNIQGSRERIFDSVLPHEITHMILASHFRQPLPRWADEGAATSVECPAERDKHFRMLNQFLRTRRGIPFSTMFAMTEYPADVMPLYAQGFSLAEYLIQQGGRQKYIAFLDEGLNNDQWSAAIRRHYGARDLGQLQNEWLAWIGHGHPQLQRQTPRDGMSPDMMLADAGRGQANAPTRSVAVSEPPIRFPAQHDSQLQSATASRRPWPKPNLIYHMPDGQSASGHLASSSTPSVDRSAPRRMVPVVMKGDRHASPVRSSVAHPQPVEPARQVIIEWSRPDARGELPMCGQQGMLR